MVLKMDKEKLEQLYETIVTKYNSTFTLYDYLERNKQENSYQCYRLYGEMEAYDFCLKKIKELMDNG